MKLIINNAFIYFYFNFFYYKCKVGLKILKVLAKEQVIKNTEILKKEALKNMLLNENTNESLWDESL